jgi:hypothetical protein
MFKEAKQSVYWLDYLVQLLERKIFISYYNEVPGGGCFASQLKKCAKGGAFFWYLDLHLIAQATGVV